MLPEGKKVLGENQSEDRNARGFGVQTGPGLCPGAARVPTAARLWAGGSLGPSLRVSPVIPAPQGCS